MTKAENLLEEKVDAVICVAGGWAGGNCAHAGVDVCQGVITCRASYSFSRLNKKQ